MRRALEFRRRECGVRALLRLLVTVLLLILLLGMMETVEPMQKLRCDARVGKQSCQHSSRNITETPTER